MSNGPALWGQLLEALSVPGAVVAGGCIRDYRLGLEPKDYDIFVPVAERRDMEELPFQIGTIANLELIELGNEDDYEEAFKGDLIGVLEGELLGYPVNIISRTAHADGVEALLESFDFHILKAAWSETGFVELEHFADDLDSRTATLAKPDTSNLSHARFDRFNKRHPGVLRMVDPFQGTLDFQ